MGKDRKDTVMIDGQQAERFPVGETYHETPDELMERTLRPLREYFDLAGQSEEFLDPTEVWSLGSALVEAATILMEEHFTALEQHTGKRRMLIRASHSSQVGKYRAVFGVNEMEWQ